MHLRGYQLQTMYVCRLLSTLLPAIPHSFIPLSAACNRCQKRTSIAANEKCKFRTIHEEKTQQQAGATAAKVVAGCRLPSCNEIPQRIAYTRKAHTGPHTHTQTNTHAVRLARHEEEEQQFPLPLPLLLCPLHGQAAVCK